MNLYSWIWPDDRDRATTRGAHRRIKTVAATWQGAVTVELDADGNYAVSVGDHPKNDNGARIEVARGNVGAGRRAAVSHADAEPMFGAVCDCGAELSAQNLGCPIHGAALRAEIDAERPQP